MLRGKLMTNIGSFAAPEIISSSFLFIQLCQVSNQFIQTEKFVWIWIIGKSVLFFSKLWIKSLRGLDTLVLKFWRAEWPEILIQSFRGKISLKEINFKWITFFLCIQNIPYTFSFFGKSDFFSRKLIFCTVIWLSLSIQQWIRTSILINKRYH